MLTMAQYDEFLKAAIKKVSSKKYEGRYNLIINSIKEFEVKLKEYNEKQISFNTIMYQVKFYKGMHLEELKEAVNSYQSIVFSDFNGKSEIGSTINSPMSLKVWFLRYLCLKIVNTDLINVVKSELKETTITNKYNEIDMILFKQALKSKVLI